MSFSDKILNKITGRNVETVPMTRDQFIELLKKVYISKADTDEEYNMIMKTVKGGIFKDKKMESKDGRYEIQCSTGRAVGIFNMKNHNLIWIHDREKDKYYEYCAWSFRKLKKAVRKEIAGAKAEI